MSDINKPKTWAHELEGFIETDDDADQWLDDFLMWVESRGEFFGGIVHKRAAANRKTE